MGKSNVTVLEPETKSKTKTIPLYKIIYLNDDFTTFQFVVESLVVFFNKTAHDAAKLAEEVHKTGAGVAGVFSLEVAELKQEQVISAARAQKFPLQVIIEPA